MCPQRASAALLPKIKQDSRGFQNIPETEQNTRARNAPCCSQLDKKSTVGTPWTLKPPASLQSQQRKGSSWGRWGTHLCCTPQTGPQENWHPTCSACPHKTRKISVCSSAEPQHYKVSQSLQTFKWEKKDLWKCNQKNTTENPTTAN